MMTTHGSLGLGSPWTRALFPGDLRADVEATIPAGYRIAVTAQAGSAGPWNVAAYSTREKDGNGHDLEVARRSLVYKPLVAVELIVAELRLRDRPATVPLSMLRCGTCGVMLDPLAEWCGFCGEVAS